MGANRFFVFSPAEREILHETALDVRTPIQQGPQAFHQTPDGRLFIIFENMRIGEIDAETFAIDTVAERPEDYTTVVLNGGVVHEGRLYFCTRTDLVSWEIQ
jgi:hypothetical protein